MLLKLKQNLPLNQQPKESAEEAPAAEEAAPEAEAAEEAPAKELASEDSEEAEKKD